MPMIFFVKFDPGKWGVILVLAQHTSNKGLVSRSGPQSLLLFRLCHTLYFLPKLYSYFSRKGPRY